MHGIKGELVKTVPTASAICGVKPWPSVTSYRSSPWDVDLIADNGDPDGRNVQTGLVNRVDRASHMGRFFVFPIPAVGFNIQNPSFVPANFMTLFVGMLRDDGQSPKTQ
jgi:hypothetical protein